MLCTWFLFPKASAQLLARLKFTKLWQQRNPRSYFTLGEPIPLLHELLKKDWMWGFVLLNRDTSGMKAVPQAAPSLFPSLLRLPPFSPEG